MDFKDIIRTAFEEYLEDLQTALKDTTSEERRFMPAAESHHIDWTVWHMARVEDDWIQRFARRTDTVWQSEGWFEKTGLPERDSGFGFTADQVRDLPAFDLDEMLGYFSAVRRETFKYLDSLTSSDLDVCPHPRRPGYTLAKMWSHLIVEEAQHVGQVAYLRGMQRGLDK